MLDCLGCCYRISPPFSSFLFSVQTVSVFSASLTVNWPVLSSPLHSIQVFHCLRHEGTGGRTLLVDGFYAADQVLQQAPDDFKILSGVPLKHEYIENVGGCHNHMIGVGPVLNIYPWNNELYLIRWSSYHHSKKVHWNRDGQLAPLAVFPGPWQSCHISSQNPSVDITVGYRSSQLSCPLTLQQPFLSLERFILRIVGPVWNKSRRLGV